MLIGPAVLGSLLGGRQQQTYIHGMKLATPLILLCSFLDAAEPNVSALDKLDKSIEEEVSRDQSTTGVAQKALQRPVKSAQPPIHEDYQPDFIDNIEVPDFDLGKSFMSRSSLYSDLPALCSANAHEEVGKRLNSMSYRSIFENYASCVSSAAEHDYSEIMRTFMYWSSSWIHFGADQVEIMTAVDELALEVAVRLGHTKTLAVLLKSPRLYKTGTMLKMLASEYLTDAACAELLLNNLKFWKNVVIPVRTPIAHGHPAVACKIVESGWAEILDTDLLLAASRGYNDFCELILSKPEIHVDLLQADTFEQMLYLTVHQGNTELAESILDTPRLDKSAVLPIWDALQREDDSMVRLLVSHERAGRADPALWIRWMHFAKDDVDAAAIELLLEDEELLTNKLRRDMLHGLLASEPNRVRVYLGFLEYYFGQDRKWESIKHYMSHFFPDSQVIPEGSDCEMQLGIWNFLSTLDLTPLILKKVKTMKDQLDMMSYELETESIESEMVWDRYAVVQEEIKRVCGPEFPHSAEFMDSLLAVSVIPGEAEIKRILVCSALEAHGSKKELREDLESELADLVGFENYILSSNDGDEEPLNVIDPEEEAWNEKYLQLVESYFQADRDWSHVVELYSEQFAGIDMNAVVPHGLRDCLRQDAIWHFISSMAPKGSLLSRVHQLEQGIAAEMAGEHGDDETWDDRASMKEELFSLGIDYPHAAQMIKDRLDTVLLAAIQNDALSETICSVKEAHGIE